MNIKNSLDWVCAMNNAQARAEEIVYKEIILYLSPIIPYLYLFR